MTKIYFCLIIAVVSCCTAKKQTDDTNFPGFHVHDGNIVDAIGNTFVPFGANSVHVWLNETDSKNALRYELAKTGMNTVRIVTAAEAWTWNTQSETTDKKEALIKLAIEANLVPMIELHDGTCVNEIDKQPSEGRMGLKQIVDHWLKPENVGMLKKYEYCLMVNIANEWGPDYDQDNKLDFLNGYKDAITRMRNAGIKNMLVIDAGGCGQDPRTLLQFADSLLEHDPLHNIVGSIHLYGMWRTNDLSFKDTTPPYSVEELLPKLADLHTPIIIGEFGWSGVGTTVNYNPNILLEVAMQNNLSWLFWAWHSNHNEIYFNITGNPQLKYNSAEDLTPAGMVLVNQTSRYAFNKVAKPAAIFTN